MYRPSASVAPESLVLLLHDLAPGRVLPAAREDRCPVRRAVLHVEDMGKLVEDQVAARVAAPRRRHQVVPRDDGDAVLPRLTQPHLLALEIRRRRPETRSTWRYRPMDRRGP